MTKFKRKNSELSRPFSTMLVNWFITCAVFFYPTLCASVYLHFASCRKIFNTPNVILETFHQHFVDNLFFAFPLTICLSATGISCFVIYIIKIRDTHTAKMLTIFATGVVWYSVVSYAFFCGM